MAFLLAALRAGGIDTETVVIDSTPVDSGGRGVEVRDWLLMHPSHDMYCIVDDGHTESFEQCGFMPRLVQTYIGCSTDEYEGLTRVHAQSLVDLFTIPGEICSEDVTVNPAESPDLVS